MPAAEERALERCPQTITILATSHQCTLGAGHDGNHHFEITGKKPPSPLDRVVEANQPKPSAGP